MRALVVLVAATVVLLATPVADRGSASARTTNLDRVALVPNTIGVRSPTTGFAGTGWTSCENTAFSCRPRGTISKTTDGGRTWHVLRSTKRPVVAIRFGVGRIWATADDGTSLVSTNDGITWRPARPAKPAPAPCAPGQNAYQANSVEVTPGGQRWALCVYPAGAGNEAKAVFRRLDGRWKRVAWTPPPPARGYGGIAIDGYPVGFAMSDDGFGLLWESRGTLYVTRDHARHWRPLPHVARPEIDFGWAGAALPRGIGFVVLGTGGGMKRRLLVTADAGRRWRVVHRWK